MPSTVSGKSLFNNHFSHVYFEEAALRYPAAQRILAKFPHAECIPVGHYKNIFNRPNQDFQLQKHSMKLILAVKKDHFLYEGSDFSQRMGHKHFYYNSLILNCVYNCSYCYLQGMYPSANVVVFVNGDDFFDAVSKKLQSHPVYLAISYDTDLLAFENIVPYSAAWIDFARDKEELTVEIRTKSGNYKAIQRMKPAENVVLAWTLSPGAIASTQENGAPSFLRRLEAVRQATEDGWKVRLCFDPILLSPGWQASYEKCIRETFSRIQPAKIYDVSAGVFRMNAEYLRKMKKQRNDSDLLHYPFEVNGHSVSYGEQERREALAFVSGLLSEYLPEQKIFM